MTSNPQLSLVELRCEAMPTGLSHLGCESRFVI